MILTKGLAVRNNKYEILAHKMERILKEKGIKKIIHATRKKTLPNIAQKLPILDITNPIADIINKIQPNKLIFLLLIFFN
mgnify:CR=1 FL=1